MAQVSKVLHLIEGGEVRRLITDEHIRPDGRKVDEIRPLSAEIDILNFILFPPSFLSDIPHD